jgi:Tfp pilus assembly protein PilF
MKIRLSCHSCFLLLYTLISCSFGLLSLSPSTNAGSLTTISEDSSSQPSIHLASRSEEIDDPDGHISFSNALNAINHNDFAGALAFIQHAIAINPYNFDYQYVLGISYFKLAKLDEAQAIFIALIHEDSIAFQKAFFDLSAIYLQKNDWQNAIKMLEQAYSLDPGRVEFEMGYVYLKDKQYDKSLEYFNRAASTKPELQTDVLMQKAIVLLQTNHETEAKKQFLHVLEMGLTPEKTIEVRQIIDSIAETDKIDKPWQVVASLGYQYDSNVFQDPLDFIGFNTTSAGVRHKEDSLFIFSLTGRYRIINEDYFSIWGAYNHYQSNYFNNTELNIVGSRPSLQFEWNNSPYHAGLEYAYSYYWVYGKSWAGVQSLFPRFMMDHPGNWQTNIFGAVEWKIYENQSPNDRHYRFALMEMKMFPERKSHFRMQYAADFDEIGAAESANVKSHEILAGVQYPLFFEKWYFDISGRYTWKFFEYDRFISVNETRNDQQLSAIFMIFGQIRSDLYLNFMVQPIWNDSNITNQFNYDPYEFNKALVSCYLTYSF